MLYNITSAGAVDREFECIEWGAKRGSGLAGPGWSPDMAPKLKTIVSRKRDTTFRGKVSPGVDETRTWISRNVFLCDFFRDVSRQTIGFETISERPPSKM